eukprot:gene17746-21140_t
MWVSIPPSLLYETHNLAGRKGALFRGAASTRAFDLVCTHNGLSIAFASEDHARRLLAGVAACLRPGGLFFGTMPDSAAIWYKAQKSKSSPPSFKGEEFTVAFERENIEQFGTPYKIKLQGEGGRDEAHYMVHIPSFIELAREVGLQLVDMPNLVEFFEDYRHTF